VSEANIQAASDRVTNAVMACRDSGITHAEMIGVLEIIKLDVYHEMIENEKDINDAQPE
jgi:hypothetical protein